MTNALQPVSIQVEGVVLRCGCGDPDSHAGQVCPRPVEEPLGVVAEWHRDLLRRILARIDKES